MEHSKRKPSPEILAKFSESPYPALRVEGLVVRDANLDARKMLELDPVGRNITELLNAEGIAVFESVRQSVSRKQHVMSHVQDGSYRIELLAEGEDCLLVYTRIGAKSDLPELMFNLDVQIREKLSTLLPSLDLLEESLSGEDEQTLSHLGAARQGAFALLRLAHNLRGVGKGLMDVDYADSAQVDLVPLFRSVCEHTEQMASFRNAHVTLHCEEESFIAYVDATRLERALYSLLANAVQNSHEGGEVVLHLLRRNGNIVIQVVDFGCGISAEEMARYYDSYRVFSLAGKGVGLGVPLVAQTARAHNGAFFMESREDAGTSVSLILPDVTPGSLSLRSNPLDYYGDYPLHLIELSVLPGNGEEYIHKP